MLKLHQLESVADHPSGMELHRAAVPGGWLYIVQHWDADNDRPIGNPSLAYVPDPTRSVELLDAAQGVVDVYGDFMQRIAEESDLHEAVNALQQALGDCR